jgi:hypothetical protein
MAMGRQTSFEDAYEYSNLPDESTEYHFVHATNALLKAEENDKNQLSKSLGATVPETWPPPTVVHPDPSLDWKNLYLVAHDSNGEAGVVAGIYAYARYSDVEGTVLLGMSVLQDEMKRGSATEAFSKLTEWVLGVTHAKKAFCDIPEGRHAAASALEKVGYKKMNASPSPGFIRFEFQR